MKKLLALLALILPICISSLQAQKRQGASTEIGFMAGLSLYSGDLAPRELGLYFNSLHPAVGIFGRINPHRMLSLRLGLTQAKVSGDDVNSAFPDRMLNFRSSITEFALSAEISPFQLGDYRQRLVVAPYLFGGGAIYRFNPQTLYDGSWINLQPLGTEGQGLAGYEPKYSLTQVAVPLGVGLKFTFRQVWSLGAEFGARKLFNDYLDDITGAQVNYLDVLAGNGTLAANLSNPQIKEPQDVTYTRGGQFDDWYYVGGITLSFRLQGGRNRPGRGMGCPTF